MGTRPIDVGWDSKSNEPTADDIVVDLSEGQTTIEWNAKPGISKIQISSLDTTQFQYVSGDNSSQVKYTDFNSNSKNKEYKYDITATYGGVRGTRDPKITNGGRPTTGLPKPRPKTPEPQP